MSTEKKNKTKQPPLPAMDDGLMVIVVHAAPLFPQVRLLLEREALAGASVAEISMPADLPLISVYSTDAELTEGQVLAASLEQKDAPTEQKFESLGLRREMNVFTNEGLALIAPLIEEAEEGWFSLAQKEVVPSAASVAIGLERLRDFSDQHYMRTMLFLNHAAIPADLNVAEYCDLYVEARPCESDPDFDGAFSLLVPSYKGLWHSHQGTALYNFAFRKGTYRFQSDRFISASVMDRYIWNLYCDGVSMENIGKKVGLSRSAVSRRLDKMPPKKKLNLPDGWESLYVAHLEDRGMDSNADAEE